MMKLLQIAGVLGILAVIACVESGKKKTETQAVSEPAVAEKSGIAAPSDGSQKIDATNIMRYAMGSDEFASWGYLISKSKWTEKFATGNYTLLCPTSEVMANGDRMIISELKRPENKDLLDMVMGNHILKTQMTYDQFLNAEVVETMSGRKWKVDRQAKTIEGIAFKTQDLVAAGGNIIVLDDIIEYPVKELKASAARNAKNTKNKSI